MPPQDTETARWFAEHVQLHEPVLRGYLRGMVSSDDIDDIVQETYIRLLRARERGPIESLAGCCSQPRAMSSGIFSGVELRRRRSP